MPGVPVKVLVVDAHELFRRGVGAALASRDGIEVVAEASSGEEALRAVAERSVDVVLLEVSLPGIDGFEVIRRLSAMSKPPRVLMLTASHKEADLYAAVRAGAGGYLVKEATGDDVADAIRAVVRGESPVSPTVASRLLDEFNALAARVDADDSRPALSSRQLEVLGLVARGLSNRDVAKALFISENTVKNHLRNILEKLQVRTRVEAAMLAVRDRMIEVDGQFGRRDMRRGGARATGRLDGQ